MKTQRSQTYSRRAFLRMAGAVSLAGALAACAPPNRGSTTQGNAQTAADQPTNPPGPEMVTIVFGRHDAVDGDVANVTAFQEKFPNIKVEQQQIGEFATQVPALAAAGNLPDVFRSWEAMSLDLARANLLLDLQPMVDADSAFQAEDFVENWWNWPVLDGKRIGVPDVIAPHVCFYNADLFDSKGVAYPDQDNFTWEDFEAKARQITDSANLVFGSETMPIGWTYFHLKMVWQNGGDFYTPDFKKCIIDSPEAIEAIQYWADLLLCGEVMPSPSQIVEEGGIGADANLMQAGKIGLQRDGVWVMNNLIQGGFRFNFVPEPSQKRRDTITHGAYNTIPVTTKNVDAAWQWLNFHCSTEGIYNYGVEGKFPGSRRSANLIEPHQWIVDLPFEVNWDVIPQSVEYGHVLPGPANEGEANKLLNDALQAIYAGDAKAADLLPEIAPQVTGIVSQV
jgi:multiple sugar transport system substrate-binding protein